MTHAELQRLIEQECDRLGHWYYAPRNAIGSQPGWVDMVILGSRIGLFAEVKTEQGRRTMAQLRVATRLQICGLQYRLWREEQWTDGTIKMELLSL